LIDPFPATPSGHVLVDHRLALEAAGVGSNPRVLHDTVVTVPKNQHHPSPAERDERVKLDLPPDEAIMAILETGPHPEEADEQEER